MKFFKKTLTKTDIESVLVEYGSYLKVTVDIENLTIVVGCKLHADAVPLLVKKGSVEEDIWGGWVNVEDKEIETNAIWNIRDSNPSMEILDSKIREKFMEVVKSFFADVFTK